MSFILGKKIEMSQIFDDNGNVVPITLIEAGPCIVLQIKSKEKDGYDAIQIGFEKMDNSKLKKTMKGKPFRYIREFRGDIKKYKTGQRIDVSVFKESDKVKISGISKGKGFQGVVKRWGFAGKNATHGVKHEHRTMGSAGATGPARVFKGKKMPGRMGSERVTIKNLEIVKVDKDNNLLAVKGAVPGRRKSLLEISSL